MKTNYSITAGVYVLSTKDSACIVDSVMQLSSGDNPLIGVSVNKNNYTNLKMNEENTFSLSVLSKDVNGEIIKTFGFNTSKEVDKFKNIDYEEINNLKIIKDSIGYMILDKVNTIDCETHTLFIGRLKEQKRYNEKEELIYQYYQKNKDEYLKIKVENKTIWVCSLCGYIYEGDELPNDFTCPLCGASKDLFEKKINNN